MYGVQYCGQRTGDGRAAKGSVPWTANGEWELYGVQDRGQRTGEWELYGVQDRGQRTGNGSCAGFSTVDSGQGTGEVLKVQHRG